MGKRRIGRRRVKTNGTFRETGFSSNAAEAEMLGQIRGIDATINAQDARTNKVLDKSNAARQKLVDKGLFGGLG